MRCCQFLAFGDLHHYPGEFYDDKWERWEKIVARSVAENAEFIVAWATTSTSDFAVGMMDSPKELYCCLGNHDTEHSPLEYVLRCIGCQLL